MKKTQLDSGKVAVGNTHELYYELHGNPNGKLMVVLHGGPGSCFKQKHTSMCNLEKYKVLFFDQRGCGLSTAKNPLMHNTTQDLVADIKLLIAHVGEKRAILCGGSWGSTLALCFAIAHPQMVSELRISGIFLATEAETDFSPVLAKFAPDLYEFIMSEFGSKQSQSKPQSVFTHLTKLTLQGDTRAAYALQMCECAIMSPMCNTRTIMRDLQNWNKRPKVIHLPSVQIYAHYLLHNFFLPEAFILHTISKISHIKTRIVQGAQDLLCQPHIAYSLSRELTQCSIKFVRGAHYEAKGDTTSQLKQALSRLYN